MKTENRIARFLGLAAAKEAGRQAALNNDPPWSNEFAVGSGQWKAWEAGYCECFEQMAQEERHRQALAAVTRDLEREAASKAVASGRISEEREAMDAGEPQPKAVSLFDCLMHFFCRNPAKGRA